jgi:hypothetical protein
MPSRINSTTTSPGGLISTGDSDNSLLIQTGDTTAITVNSSQVVSLTNPLPVASGGTGANSNAAAPFALKGANSDITSLSGLTTALSVAQGGTGSNVAATAATNLGLGTGSNVQHASLGIGTAASGTAGEIRATNNITAYFSSDISFKENIRPIDGATAKVVAIGGKYFDWKDAYIAEHGGEDGYFIQKADFGVVAQDVQAAFPQAVRSRPDGSLAVDYEKLSALAFAAIAELVKRVEALEAK